MALVGEIIEEAFREGNFIGELNSPTPKQGREAVSALNRLITNLWGDDAGEPLSDWPLGSYGRETGQPVCPPLDHLQRPTINRRMIATNDAAITVYLTLAPQDGSRMGIVDPFSRLATFPVTVDGNGRTIENAANVVLNTNGASREWFYRADLGGWKKLSDLTAADDLPFPDDFTDLFSIALALRLAPRYDRQIANSSIAVMQKQRGTFVARYLQSQPLQVDDSISWPFMSHQGWDTQSGFSSRNAFNRGSYRG